MEIAERQGMSLPEAKATTTATGFWRWVARFEEEANEKKVEHFYYAQLTSAITCLPFYVWGKQPPRDLLDLDNYLLGFGPAKEKAKRSPEERTEQDVEMSMGVWLHALGLDKEGNRTRPLKVTLPPDMARNTPAQFQQDSISDPQISIPSPDPGPGSTNPRPTPDPAPEWPVTRKPQVWVKGKKLP